MKNREKSTGFALRNLLKSFIKKHVRARVRMRAREGEDVKPSYFALKQPPPNKSGFAALRAASFVRLAPHSGRFFP
jgi:hypothetical protein